MANGASKDYQLVNIWIEIFLYVKNVLVMHVIIERIDYGYKTFKKYELRFILIFLWTIELVKIKKSPCKEISILHNKNLNET